MLAVLASNWLADEEILFCLFGLSSQSTCNTWHKGHKNNAYMQLMAFTAFYYLFNNTFSISDYIGQTTYNFFSLLPSSPCAWAYCSVNITTLAYPLMMLKLHINLFFYGNSCTGTTTNYFQWEYNKRSMFMWKKLELLYFKHSTVQFRQVIQNTALHTYKYIEQK
jgi:hypothetical protein